MLFSILWRLMAFILLGGIMVELWSIGREALNMPSDVMVFLGTLLNVATLILGVYMTIVILKLNRRR